MGVEHSLMDTLWNIATGEPAATLSMLSGNRRDSPNQKLLRIAIWLLQSPTGSRRQEDALEKAYDFFFLTDKYGHQSIGLGGLTEILTPSHAQLWHAAWAGILWAAYRDSLEHLQDLIKKVYRTETALCGSCVYVASGLPRSNPDESSAWRQADAGPDGPEVLTPGARAGKPGQHLHINPLRSEIVEAILEDSVEKLRTPRHGNYSAAIPLLKNAIYAGAKVEDLVGAEGTRSLLLPDRFSWNYWSARPSYYAWFSRGLEGAYDALWGAGYVNDKEILCWTQEEAIQTGERLSGGSF